MTSLPFDVITRREYVEIGGLALSSPAWECVDCAGLYDAPPVRGGEVAVPYHEGSIASRRLVAARRVVLGMIVFGNRDRDGNRYDDPRTGLRANLDALKREVARPVQNSTDGTRMLRHVFVDGEVRQAPCQVIPPLQVAPASQDEALCTIDVLIPGGVLRSPDEQFAQSASVPGGTTSVLSVPNGGTADQFSSVIELSGSATEVVLSNLSWDPTGGTWLKYTGSIADGITIDTDAWTAVTGLGAAVPANVRKLGHERWLPLQPGANLVDIAPTGGSATVRIAHYPAWL